MEFFAINNSLIFPEITIYTTPISHFFDKSWTLFKCLPWKNIDHWVNSILLVPVSKGHHLNAIGKKGSVKKLVQQNNLSC